MENGMFGGVEMKIRRAFPSGDLPVTRGKKENGKNTDQLRALVGTAIQHAVRKKQPETLQDRKTWTASAAHHHGLTDSTVIGTVPSSSCWSSMALKAIQLLLRGGSADQHTTQSGNLEVLRVFPNGNEECIINIGSRGPRWIVYLITRCSYSTTLHCALHSVLICTHRYCKHSGLKVRTMEQKQYQSTVLQR